MKWMMDTEMDDDDRWMRRSRPEWWQSEMGQIVDTGTDDKNMDEKVRLNMFQ
jgi:hypothetical protein